MKGSNSFTLIPTSLISNRTHRRLTTINFSNFCRQICRESTRILTNTIGNGTLKVTGRVRIRRLRRFTDTRRIQHIRTEFNGKRGMRIMRPLKGIFYSPINCKGVIRTIMTLKVTRTHGFAGGFRIFSINGISTPLRPIKKKGNWVRRIP